jgi:hypothetical protein
MYLMYTNLGVENVYNNRQFMSIILEVLLHKSIVMRILNFVPCLGIEFIVEVG